MTKLNPTAARAKIQADRRSSRFDLSRYDALLSAFSERVSSCQDPLGDESGIQRSMVAAPAARLALGRNGPEQLALGLCPGWNNVEPWGVWSQQRKATVRVRPPVSVPGGIRCDLHMSVPFPDRLSRTVTIEAASGSVQVDVPQSSHGEVLVTVPLPVVKASRSADITVSMAVSSLLCPKDFGGSDDRVLGVALRALHLSPLREETQETPTLQQGHEVRGGRDLARLLGGGWHDAEPTGVWSSSTVSWLHLRVASETRGDLGVAFGLAGLAVPDGLVTSRVAVFANGLKLGDVELARGGQTCEIGFLLPESLYAASRGVEIAFLPERLRSPSEDGGSDTRSLGVRLEHVALK